MLSVKNISITTLLAALVLAMPASAAADPDVYEAPKISGTAQVGKTLTASGGKGRDATGYGYVWLRCTDDDSIWSCTRLWDKTSTTYVLGEPDKGKHMRVAFYARRGDVCDWWDPRDCDWEESPATAAVAAAPTPTPTPTPTATPRPTVTPTPTPTATPKPTVTPTPTATPRPTATPTPSPTPEPEAAAQPAGESFVLAATVSAPHVRKPAKVRKTKMMRPFPTIRISGRLTRAGADIKVLTVKAPKGVRITLTCSGRACPLREVSQATAGGRVWHIPQFERELRAGTKLTITVAKAGYMTKVTTIQIRRGKAPTRSDRCRAPDSTRLTRCAGA